MSEQCVAVKDDGERCGVAFGLCDECGACWAHCEHRAEERRAAQARGARTTNRKAQQGSDRAAHPDDAPAAPETMRDAVRWASWTARAVAIGDLDTKRAREVTSAVREFRSGLEKAALERELADLRAVVAELKKRR